MVTRIVAAEDSYHDRRGGPRHRRDDDPGGYRALSLMMAALMVPGGKLGDILGRRRTFTIGHAIYTGLGRC